MADPMFCTVADVAKYAGEGVSATSVAEAYVLVYGVGAESFINVMTGVNYSDIYTASMNADKKKLLSDIQARLIAIDVINYNVNGLASRAHAETRMNVLYQRAMDGINLLKEQGKTDYLTLNP